MDAVRKVGRQLQIGTFRFVRIVAETTDSAFAERPRELEVRVGFTEPEICSKDEQLAISSTFALRVEIADKPGGEQPFVRIIATAELLYRRTEAASFSDEELRQFANINVPLNAWPYWRELTQSAFVRLGLPVVRLPLAYGEQIAQFMLGQDEIGEFFGDNSAKMT